jgi:hypothetical protein
MSSSGSLKINLREPFAGIRDFDHGKLCAGEQNNSRERRNAWTESSMIHLNAHDHDEL